MNCILITDVKGLGKKGDVVKVKDGYFHNFLAPQKKAVPATDASMRELEQQKQSQQRKDELALAACKEKKQLLENKQYTIEVKAGEHGKIFGSVTSIDIVEAVKKSGAVLDKKQVDLKSPIKEIGEYTVSVKLHPQVQANLKVIVKGV